MFDSAFLYAQAQRYAGSKETKLVVSLGAGTDGVVFRSDRKTAVKALAERYNYELEVECYRRLNVNGITKIHEFNVPCLIDYSDDLQVIEMDIVTPPYVLDFGKVYLDIPPHHTGEVWQDWEDQGQLRYDDRWPKVKSLLRALERFGIYYQDPKPGNIMFADWGQTLDDE